ncbi:hypothetical protein OC844_004343 [Tilletia horrida]|nr:hypothetical protein OC844_004343 [Tilletia horrida]
MSKRLLRSILDLLARLKPYNRLKMGTRSSSSSSKSIGAGKRKATSEDEEEATASASGSKRPRQHSDDDDVRDPTAATTSFQDRWKGKGKAKATSDKNKDSGSHGLLRLPPELIQMVLHHVLALLEPERRQIHYKHNHAAHNRKIAQIASLSLVCKTFHHMLTPHLFHTLHLPRHFGYAHSCTSLGDPEMPALHKTDAFSKFLRKALKRNANLATLVKAIHVDPVVRLRGCAARDAVTYSEIIEACKDELEELAIAVNSCDGVIVRHRSSARRIETESLSLVLERIQNLAFPKLRRLTLEVMEPEQLNWIRWKQLPNLTSVTFLADYLFMDQTAAITHVSPKRTNLFLAMKKLPPTVTTLTFGFFNLVEERDVARFRRLTHNLPSDFDDVHFFVRNLRAVLAELAKDSRSAMHRLQRIRLVWTHSPYVGQWCDSCLRRHRETYYDLPKLQRIYSVERKYREVNGDLEPLVRFSEPKAASATSAAADEEATEAQDASAASSSIAAPVVYPAVFPSASASSSTIALPPSAPSPSASTFRSVQAGPSSQPQTQARPKLEPKHVSDSEDSTPALPELEFFEIKLPPAFESNEEGEAALHALEVLWKALLYNEPGDELLGEEEEQEEVHVHGHGPGPGLNPAALHGANFVEMGDEEDIEWVPMMATNGEVELVYPSVMSDVDDGEAEGTDEN